MDSAQFALAMDEFDVTLHQPQPPGYFLYVMAARLLNLFIHDHNTSLITISILCSGMAAASVFYFSERLFGRDAAWYASLAFIASPSLWFHSEVALSYMPEALMSVLVAISCHRALSENGKGLNLAGVLLALSGGIRQSSFVFLLPLFIYTALRSGVRKSLSAFGLTALTLALWGVPMLYATGGLEKYLAYMNAHWSDSNWRGITLYWTIFNAKHMLYFVSSGLGLVAVPLLAWPILFRRKAMEVFPRNEERYMFALWILPALTFHLFIFTHPAVPGHSLIYVVGLIILGSGMITRIAERVSSGSENLYKKTFRVITAVTVLVGTTIFFTSPGFISYPGIRTHDRVLESYINTVRENFTPDDTEIVGSNRFMYSFRQAMYYLPDFRIFGDEMINTPDGPRLFLGYRRMTTTEPCISFRPSTRYVVDFINHPQLTGDLPPPGAKLVESGQGLPLVYYDDTDSVRMSERISPHLCSHDDTE